MSSRALLFDLDGTLIDSRADLAAAVNRMRADLELAPLPVATVAGYVGEGLRKLVTRSLPEKLEQVEQACAATAEHYRQHLLDQTVLYPGVADALHALRELGYALAVVTNKPQAHTEIILDGLGIRPFFAAIVGGGACPKLKPDPEPLFLALQRCGVADTAGSWIVGDHFTDLEAGRRAGLKRCYCRYGFGDPQTESWDLAVDRLTELAEYLRED